MNENCTSLWAAWFVFYLYSILFFFFRLFEGLKSKTKVKFWIINLTNSKLFVLSYAFYMLSFKIQYHKKHTVGLITFFLFFAISSSYFL